MKVSIVTVVYNGEGTVGSAAQSVAEQDYDDIEYIVVDGGSSDGTLEVLKPYSQDIAVLISEPDNGIYDAMNKGIAHATGDVIGFLNADDMLASPKVISSVVAHLKDSGTDSVIGDLVFVRPGNLDRVVRYYSSKDFQLDRFEKGDMPPHPTFYAKRSLYEKLGNFRTKYRIVADFELMLRFLYKEKVSFTYLPVVMVKMRTGGVSNRGIKSKIALNREIQAALKANGMPASMMRIYSKYFTKIFQLVKRPKASPNSSKS